MRAAAHLKMRTRYLATTVACVVLNVAAMAMPIPADVKQCLAFLYVTDSAGKSAPNGTGFFVGIPSANDPNQSYVYLVTAGHVTKVGNDGPLFSSIQVRLNRRDGTTELLSAPLIASGPGKTIFTPSDPTVDLAVIPVSVDDAKYDYKFIPAALLPTDAELKELPVQEGADVFFAGLFVYYVSDRLNIPIVRFGRVALVTDEPILWGGIPRSLLLIECSSFGGNSGAPVFYYLGAERNPGSITVGTPILRLAGVMMGAYQDVKPLQVVSTSSLTVSTSNLGIAAVVPVSKLRDLLFGTELLAVRAAASKP